MIQAANSPSDAYEYEYAEPDTGIADASSAYDSATSAHSVPVMMNETMIAGPANCAAARPVSTNMPVPMMQPMPSSTRFVAPSVLLSSPCSCSACICSTDLRTKMSRRERLAISEAPNTNLTGLYTTLRTG